MKLGDIKGEFQADELTGTFNALNETTNFKPTQRDEIGVIHPSYMPTQGDEIGIIHPSYKPDPRGYDPGPVGSPVELNSLDVGPVNKTADTGWGAVDWRDLDVVIGNGIHLDTEAPSMSMHQGAMNSFQFPDAAGNFRDAAGNMTETSDSFGCGENNPISTGQPVEAPLMHQGAMNSVWLEDLAGNMTETFEPLPGMDSFGRSLNPVAELGGTAGPGATSFLTGQFDMPTNNLAGSADPGGDDI